MDTEINLRAADRDVLIGIIVRQQAIIERLEKRIAQLEGQAKPSGSRRMPGLKPKADRKPAGPKGPRKPRPHGFARGRMTPTHRVEHVVEQCPDCGTQLSGGWAQRTREVIDLPQVPAHVTEHVYLARTCPQCRRCCSPKAQLDGVVMGKQRLGVNVISLIAALREEARLALRTIQWYLDTVHGLCLSRGAVVDATRKVAGKAQTELAGILERIRGSPVVHADETGWREDGHNGYVCEPLTNHFQHPHRALLPAAGSRQGGGRRSAGRVILRSAGQQRVIAPGRPLAGVTMAAGPLIDDNIGDNKECLRIASPKMLLKRGRQSRARRHQ